MHMGRGMMGDCSGGYATHLDHGGAARRIILCVEVLPWREYVRLDVILKDLTPHMTPRI
jgi:hypothetical protein